MDIAPRVGRTFRSPLIFLVDLINGRNPKQLAQRFSFWSGKHLLGGDARFVRLNLRIRRFSERGKHT
jgi:hypothetical protein